MITDNPVDLAGSGEQDFRNFERVTAAVLESGEVDAVLLTGYFGGYSQMNEEFRTRETEVAREIAAVARAEWPDRSSRRRCSGARRPRWRCGRAASPSIAMWRVRSRRLRGSSSWS